MAYFIEFGQDQASAFHAEFVIRNASDRSLVSPGGIDHQFRIRSGWFRDYGETNNVYLIVASTSNGRITTPAPGLVVVAIPPSSFQSYAWSDYGWVLPSRRTLKFDLVAVPADPDFTSTLATGTISFGDRMMPCPRVKQGALPLYPNVIATVGPGALNGLVPSGSGLRSSYLEASEQVAPGSVVNLATSIPADPRNPVALAWADAFVAPGNPLDMFNRTTNALSQTQAAQIFAIATTLPTG